METQLVTVAIVQAVLAQAEQLAARRGISLSGLLTRLIEDEVDRERSYALAAARQLSFLERGLDLGTNSVADWSREDLHSR